MLEIPEKCSVQLTVHLVSHWTTGLQKEKPHTCFQTIALRFDTELKTPL